MTKPEALASLREMRTSWSRVIFNLSKTLAPNAYALWTQRLAALDFAIKELSK